MTIQQWSPSAGRLGPSLVAVLFAACVSVALADEPIYSDPAQAEDDIDYVVQGEYADDDWGVQVRALGSLRFDGYIYEGGLPGAGWDGENVYYARGQSDGQVAMLLGQVGVDNFRVLVVEGKAQVHQSGQMLAELEPVMRESPTLGKQPPEGAVVLFESPEDVDNWRNGRVDDNGYLMQGVTSHETFGDHTVHVEFRIPYRPQAEGQGRGNSGIYLQGRYEVQMLDSFAIAEAQHHDNGGIYSVKAPDVNMSFPPLVWQTYDIEFTAARFDDEGNKTANARMTVYHNGVKIHDDVEVPNPTPAAPHNDEAGPGPVYLQDHGNPVRYRNVWVVEH